MASSGRDRFGFLALWLALLGACGGGEEPRPEAASPAPAGSAAGPTTAASHRLPPRPAEPVDDVVLVTLDTLRADALGFAGNRSVATPALDALAAAGWVFDDAHAHNVVTLPSHANILTGLYPYQHGIRDNTGFVLPGSVPTAAALLGAAGFATGAVVAAYPLDARFGLDRGFDLYDDDYNEGSHPTEFVVPERAGDEVVERGLAWWREHRGERRFLWIHLYDPHAPYEAPEPFAGRHRDDPYYGEVEAVDAYLAPLFEALAAEEEPPLLVVTSDHGEALGDHGEVTHGLFAYEPTLAVPLVIHGPGLGSGHTGFPAGHVDLLPTILAATGVEVPPGLAGGVLFAPGGGGSAGSTGPTGPTGPTSPEGSPGSTDSTDPESSSGSGTSEIAATATAPRDLYFESLSPMFNQGFAPLRGLIRGGDKLISLPLPELYRLAADPAEANNLFDAERDRARELARRLPAESVWPPERGVVAPEAEEALRSLGYLTGSAPRQESYGPEDDPKTLVELDRKVHAVVFLYQQGKLDEAEKLAREVVAERPQMGLAWSYLAQVLLQRHETEEAIAAMQEAERLGVARDSLIRQLGLSLAELGRHDEAMAALERFGDADDIDVLNALALVHSEANRQPEARAALERLLAIDPRNPVAHQNMALVALRSGAWEPARQHATAALEVNDGLGLAWNYLGTALYNLGRPAEALDAWDRAVAAEPDSWDALYNIALVASEIGDRERSREALERFVATAPPERYGADIQRARGLLRQMGR